MTTMVWALALVLAGLLPPTPSPHPSAAVGKQAPDFHLAGLDGSVIARSRFAGRPMFIHVFTTTCAPCRAEIPAIVAAYRRYGSRVAFLAVDERESTDRVTRFVKSMRMPYVVGIDDGTLAATYEALALPRSVFIDAGGVVRRMAGEGLTKSDLDAALHSIAPA